MWAQAHTANNKSKYHEKDTNDNSNNTNEILHGFAMQIFASRCAGLNS